MIELLSPVGDFECLKAAVQNGADAVYFGANSFNARAFASNFDDDILEKAITYAKLRGVKTNLTLNTLIKNDEMNEAIEVAKKAYEYGIDAIIVQDLGLARYLIKNFPGLAIHASTQMSVHNLEGVLELQKMGFSRVVLSRELSLQEIEYICKNSNIEIEVFVHGALCISYSGQCLFSSMIGGRSGNRGKCAQPCRLPYELLEESQPSHSNFSIVSNAKEHSTSLSSIDKGYLLSPRDLCGLEFLPELVKAGVSCLKIEGRMKTPEYVATVTKIYRKYLDLALSGSNNFQIDEQDKKDLLQVFNRGGFSSGHLKSEPNRELVYKQKSNNMGIFLGTISNFNSSKGHISFTTTDTVCVGDKISIENKKHETSIYTISELMINDKNVPKAFDGNKIKIGRMKGNISIGDRIYKVSDKSLTTTALNSLNLETRKTDLNCKMIVKKNIPVELIVFDNAGISINLTSDIFPVDAVNSPITKERLIAQISKTNNTPFSFKNIEIDLDDGLYIPSISGINELRRQALSQYEEKFVNSFRRKAPDVQFSSNMLNSISDLTLGNTEVSSSSQHFQKISVLLNLLDPNYNYANLKNVDRIYIPFKYFILKKFENTIDIITKNFDTYIYMPTIIRNNYKNLIFNNMSKILESYDIKGFVVSNIGNFELLKNYRENYEFISNYTLNVFNDLTINELQCNVVTLSPELNKLDLQTIKSAHFATNSSCIERSRNMKNCHPEIELIVYGRTPLMNSNYCLLGKSNKCYSSCSHKCNSGSKFYLKDRLGFLFRIIPDNIETVTTIFNSKITSIEHKDVSVDSVRIDILDESVSEINNIVDVVKSGEKLEGNDYTNGSFNR